MNRYRYQEYLCNINKFVFTIWINLVDKVYDFNSQAGKDSDRIEHSSPIHKYVSLMYNG